MKKPIDTSRISFKPTRVTFLEMHEAPDSRVAIKENTRFELLKRPIGVDRYRELYYGVGENFFWLDRMVMSEEELFPKINASNVDIYVMYVDDQPAGFAEFLKEEDFTEILYFGLMPAFVGQGLGKYFLLWVIQQAWSYQPKWIQVNTCQLDHPNALPVYKSVGFRPVKSTIEQRRILSA